MLPPRGGWKEGGVMVKGMGGFCSFQMAMEIMIGWYNTHNHFGSKSRHGVVEGCGFTIRILDILFQPML